MKQNRIRSMTAMAGAAMILSALSVPMTLQAAEPIENAPWKESDTLVTADGGEMKLQRMGMVPENVADVFDADYYAGRYPDLKAAFGDDAAALYQHFVTQGLAEGRVGSRVLHIAKYRVDNPDLEDAFGDDWDLYVWHYFHRGILEQRSNGFERRKSSALHYTAPDGRQIYVAGAEDEIPGAIYDDRGNVFVPLKYYTLDRNSLSGLIELFGESTVALLDKEGNIAFLGGHLSEDRVDDVDDVRAFFDQVSQLFKFSPETQLLRLITSHADTLGGINYRFAVVDQKTQRAYVDAAVVIGVDEDGYVIAISASDPSRYAEESKPVPFADDLGSISNEKIDAQMAASGYKPQYIYWSTDEESGDLALRRLYYNEEQGLYAECDLKAQEEDDSQPYWTVTNYRYFVTNPHPSREGTLNLDGTEWTGEDTEAEYDEEDREIAPFSYDYFFLARDEDGNLVERDTKRLSFVDSSGKTIELSVGMEEIGEETAYYFLDTKRHLVGIRNLDGEVDGVDRSSSEGAHPDNLIPLYFYVKKDSNGKDTYYYLDDKGHSQDLEATFISAMASVSQTWDVYQQLGMYDNPVAYLIGLNVSNDDNNAYESTLNGAVLINVENHEGNQAFDAIAHEMTHSVLRMYVPSFNYLNEAGAINESYADILGNLIEMLYYDADGNAGEVSELLPNLEGSNNWRGFRYVDDERWLFNEDNENADPVLKTSDTTTRDLSDPNAKDSVARIGDRYFRPSVKSGTEGNDNGWVHTNSGILEHIAYRMAQEAGMSKDEVFRVWFDTLPYLTQDTTFGEMRQYVTFMMEQHSCTPSQVEQVEGFFKDAGIKIDPETGVNQTDVSTWSGIKTADPDHDRKITLSLETKEDQQSAAPFKIYWFEWAEEDGKLKDMSMRELGEDRSGIFGRVISKDLEGYLTVFGTAEDGTDFRVPYNLILSDNVDKKEDVVLQGNYLDFMAALGNAGASVSTDGLTYEAFYISSDVVESLYENDSIKEALYDKTVTPVIVFHRVNEVGEDVNVQFMMNGREGSWIYDYEAADESEDETEVKPISYQQLCYLQEGGTYQYWIEFDVANKDGKNKQRLKKADGDEIWIVGSSTITVDPATQYYDITLREDSKALSAKTYPSNEPAEPERTVLEDTVDAQPVQSEQKSIAAKSAPSEQEAIATASKQSEQESGEEEPELGQTEDATKKAATNTDETGNSDKTGDDLVDKDDVNNVEPNDEIIDEVGDGKTEIEGEEMDDAEPVLSSGEEPSGTEESVAEESEVTEETVEDEEPATEETVEVEEPAVEETGDVAEDESGE